MDEVIDIDAPVSTNGQAPEAPPAPAQRPLKDYSDEELQHLRRQLLANERQNSANLNLVCGVLIGRGHDIDL